MNLADRILHLCHSLGSNSVIIADSSFRESIHLSNTTSSDSSHVPLLDIATTLRIIQKSPKDCVHVRPSSLLDYILIIIGDRF